MKQADYASNISDYIALKKSLVTWSSISERFDNRKMLKQCFSRFYLNTGQVFINVGWHQRMSLLLNIYTFTKNVTNYGPECYNFSKLLVLSFLASSQRIHLRNAVTFLAPCSSGKTEYSILHPMWSKINSSLIGQKKKKKEMVFSGNMIKQLSSLLLSWEQNIDLFCFCKSYRTLLFPRERKTLLTHLLAWLIDLPSS